MLNNKDNHKYDDIIHLERPRSPLQRMSMQDRAAQFSSFAALTGYEDAVEEAGRVTESRIEIDEGVREQMDILLNNLMSDTFNQKSKCEIRFFVPDDSKNGGSYNSITGQIKRFDNIEKKLIMMDGTVINAEYIINIQ